MAAKLVLHKSVAHQIVHHPMMIGLAPADEYFGPLGLSIIGINNTMRDTSRRYDVNHDIAVQTFKSAELTERAIRAWDKKYPHDDQLPHAIYLLQRLYTKVLYAPSRDRAHMIASWLFTDFSRSPQAKQMKKTLALEHLAPIPVSTPTPAYSSVFGRGYASEFTVPAPQHKVSSPAPAPSPLPSGAPAGSP